MSKLRELATDSDAFQQMVASLLPRGPIWVPRNADIAALSAGLGDEGVRFHNRMVELMLEAYPSTTDELLDEWEDAYGLPLCGDAPTDLASRQAALAGKYAAQGGQTPAYYIDIIRAVLGDQDAVVTITERPWGGGLYAWVGSAWESVGTPELVHHWRVTVPTSTTDDQLHIIQCLLEAYKPAHTALSFRSTACSGGSASSLSISGASPYDFGTHAVGTPTAHTFTITNAGLGDANDINALALPAGFRFKGGSFPGTGGTLGRSLASAASGTVVVEFVPQVTGPASGFMTFEYCSGSTRTYVSRQLVGAGS